MNNIEDILKVYGYYKDEDYSKDDESNMNCNSDVPEGFQDVNPLIFIVIGEVIGDLISGALPFNVANTFSNLIILIGQIIEAYGTQLAYYENGPGRKYSKENRNINNPDCNNDRFLSPSRFFQAWIR